jgi:4-diphosphocytidyl-2-C-methyl-D-erythritol kinase
MFHALLLSAQSRIFRTMIQMKAYAKINLGLRIIAKRADGYHDIETILHRIDVYDELSFINGQTISFESDAPDLPSGEDNLCIRAARLLASHRGVKAGAHISLRKKIPAGAGLGGGSSDAAATLLGLNKLWGLDMKAGELLPLAAQLGSDVPYFLRDGTAYATGKGEILEYFPLQLPYWIVVLYPDIHVSTAWAYQQMALENPNRTDNLRKNLLEHLHDGERLRQSVGNDFEPTVFRAHPELGELKQLYYDHGALFAQMSGSGSSIYGLFESERGAKSVCETLAGRGKVFLTLPGLSL